MRHIDDVDGDSVSKLYLQHNLETPGNAARGGFDSFQYSLGERRIREGLNCSLPSPSPRTSKAREMRVAQGAWRRRDQRINFAVVRLRLRRGIREQLRFACPRMQVADAARHRHEVRLKLDTR